MRQVLLFSFIIGYCFCAHAQHIKYASRKLAEIGDELSLEKQATVKNGTMSVPATTDFPVVIQHNDKDELSHIGIALFPDEAKKMINYPVCNYLERLLLELALQESGNNKNDKIKEYDLTIEKIVANKKNAISIPQLLKTLKQPADFSLEKLNDNFIATWTYMDGNLLKMTFPASREVIFGTDKKEADELLYKSLKDIVCDKEAIPDEVDTALLEKTKTGLFVKRGAVFFINNMNNDMYYDKKGNSYSPVFDEKFPYESLSNSFLTKTPHPNLSLRITHRTYEEVKPSFTIPLNDFVCTFKGHFDFYCGEESLTPEEIKMTVVLKNEMYNYIHMLLIKADSRQVFSSGGILECTLYSNIPQQNIQYIFEEIER